MDSRPDDWLTRLTALARAAPQAATRLLRDRTFRVAVTGLSRAGKTVFLTSLVHNLRSAAANANHLPELTAAQEARLLETRLAPPSEQPDAPPPFPYEANLAAMAGTQAAWPPPTTGVSALSLEIDFHPAGLLRANRATLQVELVDYPGEWLLDLGLLNQTYAAWSASAWALADSGLRAPLAKDWRAYVATLDAGAPANEDAAQRAHALYRGYLIACRDRHGLSYLQPGRFLTDPASSDASLWFCPLPPDRLGRGGAASLGALMARRFDAYRTRVRAEFLAPHFSELDRQIVLVDVLRALAAGRETFDDTRRALAEIAAALRANRSWLRWLWGGGRQRVMFAATKADHVPESQRGQLEGLLRTLLGVDVLGLRGRSDFEVTRIAAVRSTTDAVQDGTPVVIGLPVGAAQRRSFFVRGGIPVEPPAWSFAGNLLHDIPVFQPPRVNPDTLDGIPHIGLDFVAEYLLGDRLA